MTYADTTHVHTLSCDKEIGEPGAIRDEYEGVLVACPHCREQTFMSLVVRHGHCIQCKRNIDIYVGFEGD